MARTCKIEDCTRSVHGRALCSTHLLLQRRTGDTVTVRRAGRPSPTRQVWAPTAALEGWSPRTFTRFVQAIDLLRAISDDPDGYAALRDKLMGAATRPHGSLNVGAFRHGVMREAVSRLEARGASLYRLADELRQGPLPGDGTGGGDTFQPGRG